MCYWAKCIIYGLDWEFNNQGHYWKHLLTSRVQEPKPPCLCFTAEYQIVDYNKLLWKPVTSVSNKWFTSDSMETSGTLNHQTLVQQGHIILRLTLNLSYFEKKMYQDILFSLTFKELQQDTPFFFRGDTIDYKRYQMIINADNLEFISNLYYLWLPLHLSSVLLGRWINKKKS